MRVLPVIDIARGVVVHAIAGERDAYGPVKSTLTSQSSPSAIGFALAKHFGATQAYLADLDAIQGTAPAWSHYDDVAKNGLKLWVDAGLSTVERAAKFGNDCPSPKAVHRTIIGLESVPSPTALEDMLGVIGTDRAVFSLDLHDGKPLTNAKAWSDMSVQKIVELVVQLGVRRLILLDLTRVGTGRGVGTEQLCGLFRQLCPELELIAGGGIRDLNDLHGLRSAGCSAVLIASAIHDGRLTPDRLREAGYEI